MNSPRRETKRAEMALRDVALAYPGAYEEFPWGHRAIKVRGKAFVFMASENHELSLSVKLPVSSMGALIFPFAAPAGYGLGKSDWVTSRFRPGETIPVGLLGTWIDESYRAIAPKRLAARLPAPADGAAPSGPSNPPRGGRARRRKPTR
jgi:predicted DNA-binding protein (MmcQ/YjbR family)